MMIISRKCGCRAVPRGVLHGSILASVLLNVFINDLDNGAECTLSKSADDTKWGEVTNRPKGVYWGLDRQEK